MVPVLLKFLYELQTQTYEKITRKLKKELRKKFFFNVLL